MQVILLRCPHCGTAIPGSENDKVFFCASCVAGYEWKGGGWEKHALFYARPGSSSRDPGMIYLPFWRFQVRIALSAGDDKQKRALDSLQLDKVWVAGFSMIRMSYFGDPGLSLTSAHASPEKDASLTGPDLPRLSGCALNREDAEPYVRLYVLNIIDRRSDITGLEITLRTLDASLWAIPFLDQGDTVVDVYTGREYPAFCIDDLESMRTLSVSWG